MKNGYGAEKQPLSARGNGGRKYVNGFRLGLCCIFKEQPIQFRARQARYIERFEREVQLEKLAETVISNLNALVAAVSYCSNKGIGGFRVNSRILPLRTHPLHGYQLHDLPDYQHIAGLFARTADLAEHQDVRLSFHPDQFTLLSSMDEEVTRRSVEELLYQAEVAELIGADVITVHGGGAYGDKKAALHRVAQNIVHLPEQVRSRLTLENDDRIYTPEDLLPICRDTDVPLVYDVHHHRCNPDSLTVEEATELAVGTWNREPLFHLSSPRKGWDDNNPRPHADMIDINDFPECWQGHRLTIEVEAKAKELAVLELRKQLVGKTACKK